MSTIFDNIITGVWPGRFVWADDLCVAFATIEPTSPGHVLVVPRCPYEAWTDAPSDVAAHLMKVARAIGVAQKAAFGVPRAGLAIAGFEVPHTRPRRPRAPVDGIRGALLTDSAPLFLRTPRGRSQPARPPRSGGLMRARASSIGRLRSAR